ncbi:MAG: replication factor A [Candidatus Methanoperedens sp.]|nr:replication factor A [Candidatus Methanoperedens sp.]
MAVNIKEESKKIQDRFGKAGVSIDVKEIEERMNRLITEFKVQPQEAIRTIISFFRQTHNISFDDMKGTQGPADVIPIGDIKTEDGNWISLEAKVVQLWESNSDKVSQTGLIGDGTGTTKFTIFAKGAEEHPVLVEGKSYLFNNVVTSVYQGQVSVKVNKNTVIAELSGDIEVKQKSETVTGIITALSSGSGLIKRCPECNRKLSKGMCGEHGKVEGVYDLRIKGVLSPLGRSDSIDLLMNKEVTESLTGIGLDKAKEIATEALDTAIIADILQGKVVGRYYTITGSLLPSKVMLVNEVKPANIATQEIIATLTNSIETAIAGGV